MTRDKVLTLNGLANVSGATLASQMARIVAATGGETVHSTAAAVHLEAAMRAFGLHIEMVAPAETVVSSDESVEA